VSAHLPSLMSIQLHDQFISNSHYGPTPSAHIYCHTSMSIESLTSQVTTSSPSKATQALTLLGFAHLHVNSPDFVHYCCAVKAAIVYCMVRVRTVTLEHYNKQGTAKYQDSKWLILAIMAVFWDQAGPQSRGIGRFLFGVRLLNNCCQNTPPQCR
jgi:hypothetical protein